MFYYPQKIKNLIESFGQLPGIGRKTAERFVFYLLKQNKDELEKFAENLRQLAEQKFLCPECFNFSETNNLCAICENSQRDRTTICVVEEFNDLNVIESTNEFRGLYHVLGGIIDPPEGITPDKLKIRELIARVQKNSTKEIILALNPDLQGEGTIIYLKNALRPQGVKITLLARGLPMGSDLKYADEATLANALKGRREI